MIGAATALALELAAVEPGAREVSPTAIEWETSGGCEVAATAQQLAGLLGESTASASMVVVVAETDEHFAADLTIDVDGTIVQRSLEASSCEGLRSAIAIVAAVQIDAVATAASPPIQRTLAEAATAIDVVAPTPDRATTLRTPPPPVVDTAGARRNELRLAFAIGGGAAFRTLPETASMIRGGVAIHLRRARIALDVAWLLDRTARLPAPNQDAGAEIGLRGATLRGGWAYTRRRFEVPLLAGIEIADLSARGIGVSRARVRHGVWFAAVAGPGFAWVPVPAFAVVVDPAITLALGRPTFGVDAGDELRRLYQPPRIGMRLGLAVQIRVP